MDTNGIACWLRVVLNKNILLLKMGFVMCVYREIGRTYGT